MASAREADKSGAMRARRDETGARLPETRVHYQGEHSRRVARVVVVIWIVMLLWPALTTPRPVEDLLRTVVVVAVVLLVGEWLLARRMGVTVRPDGVTLHTVLGWRRLPWNRIDHFEWQIWSRPQTEWLWAITPEGKRILISTVQRPVTRGWASRFFASTRLVRRDGLRVDGLETLTRALAEGRQLPPVRSPSIEAPSLTA
jgi:hypothetical protein